MFKTRWLQPLLLIAVTSCSTGPAGSDFCLIAHPIRPAANDVRLMSDGLVQQILAHDQTGAKLCGWQAGK